MPRDRHNGVMAEFTPGSAPGALRFGPDGLLPVIAQQWDSGEVLMLAWMDEEAVRRTLSTGRATYWSRSRGQYWVKGETSGNAQHVREMRLGGARDLRFEPCDLSQEVVSLAREHLDVFLVLPLGCFDRLPAPSGSWPTLHVQLDVAGEAVSIGSSELELDHEIERR